MMAAPSSVDRLGNPRCGYAAGVGAETDVSEIVRPFVLHWSDDLIGARIAIDCCRKAAA